MKFSLCSLLLCIIVFSGCSSSHITITPNAPTVITKPSPTPILIPTPTLVPTPTSTPVPTALPLPTGNLPGWYPDQSGLWSGYSSPKQGISGIRAQWIEPQVSGGKNSEAFIWIGVGGWAETLNELIQIGTLAYTSNSGITTHQVWYETVPKLSQVTSMIIYPGDRITALMELDPGSNHKWNLSLSDVEQNTSFAIEVDYPSSQVYGDFIVEDPHINSTDTSAPLYPFQQFTSVKFTGAQVRYDDGWYPIGALLMMQITMVQGGKTLASPSSILAPDSFTIVHALP